MITICGCGLLVASPLWSLEGALWIVRKLTTLVLVLSVLEAGQPGLYLLVNLGLVAEGHAPLHCSGVVDAFGLQLGGSRLLRVSRWSAAHSHHHAWLLRFVSVAAFTMSTWTELIVD